MPRRIPITKAQQFARESGCTQVIIAAWDGKRTQIFTWGNTREACAQAAQGGNRIQEALGWPKDLRQEPARVRHLLRRIAELEAALAAAQGDGHGLQDA